MGRQLLRDTHELVAEVLDGKHDDIVDHLERAAKFRQRQIATQSFRVGGRVKTQGTGRIEYEGVEGTVEKINAKTIAVRMDTGGVLRCPPSMLVAA